jgi:regulator of sigma E protease
VLLTILFTDQNRVTKYEEHWQVTQVVKGSRAEAGGLKRGDEIVKVGDLKLPGPSWEKEILPYIQSRAEQTISFRVLREGKAVDLALTPANEGGKGRLGFGPGVAMQPLERRPLQAMDLVKGFAESSRDTVAMTGAVLAGYGKLLTGKASVKEMGGPGTIGVMAYKAAQNGWIAYFGFLAFISLNLAVLNALPIPFLDGGHAAILLFEKLRRRDLSIRVKERILMGGFVFLMGLMALVVMLDIWRFRN